MAVLLIDGDAEGPVRGKDRERMERELVVSRLQPSLATLDQSELIQSSSNANCKAPDR